MTTPLDDLIARIERATHGTFVLDCDVSAVFGRSEMPPRAYTVNPECALSLLPSDLYWLIGKGRTRPDEPLYGVNLFNPGDEKAIVQAESESLCLAICLAALKARTP